MTKIAWCERTWNPVKGCTPISAGCKNCYAAKFAKRLAGNRVRGYDKAEPFKVTFQEHVLDQPRRWRKPSLVFVCSMGDLFHENVTSNERWQIFNVMAKTPQHTYLILTKRPEIMCHMFATFARSRANVWVGASVENRATARERMGWLSSIEQHRQRCGTVGQTFVSYEPALEQIDWTHWLPDIGWLICGGESGHGARPFEDARGIQARDQCKAAGVPFFWKQRGVKDGKYETWPKEFQVRQYPKFAPADEGSE